VPPWLSSWAKRFLPWALLAALGLAAESRLYAWSNPGLWLPDLLTGWCLAGCGLIAWTRRKHGPGALLVAAGAAWFAGNFTPLLLELHRGPLVQLVLAYPHARPRRRWELVPVAAGWILALTTLAWRGDPTTLVLAALLVLVAVVGFQSSTGLERRERSYGLAGTVWLAGTLATAAALRLGFAGGAEGRVALHLYEAGLASLAVFLVWGLLHVPWQRAAVTDLVVKLGDSQTVTLRDALARALGDPSLEVGYWLEEAEAFVDWQGRALELPPEGDERSITLVERERHPVAVLIHDPAVLGDPALVDAVASATRLAGANARLQAELRARVEDVSASRRRILGARDEERSRLERRLQDGAQLQLENLGETLRAARTSAASPLTHERLTTAERQLTRTLDELALFARGIHPRHLYERGLAEALSSLAADVPLPVQLEVSPLACSPALEACIYFVCSEALTNVVKYAAASQVAISLAGSDKLLTLRIEDNGVGGADLEQGTGLRGLADRVETLGGRLSLDSPTGVGTRLTVVLPANA
jgi:signal transduction histidine kinase